LLKQVVKVFNKLLGYGNLKTNAEDEIDLITLGVNVVNSSKELQSKIYPNLEENYLKSKWLLALFCILAPRNDIIIEKINTSVMKKVPGESVVYRSFDQTTKESDVCTYPKYVLNSWNLPGLPPHRLPPYKLTLEEGCPKEKKHAGLYLNPGLFSQGQMFLGCSCRFFLPVVTIKIFCNISIF